MTKPLIKKLTDLNRVSIHSMQDENNVSIIKNFTEESIALLNADFGFAWGKLDGETYELIYKSPNTPYQPTIREDREGTHIIPIQYGDHVYGSIVLGYHTPRDLSQEELMLSNAIGDTIGHMVTINWLVEKEQKALALAEKQKEMEVLLAQEKLKTEFIANAVHEFRTPLAIMRGNVELALFDKKQSLTSAKKALTVVHDEILHLSAMLTDLATLTSPKKNAKDMLHFQEVDVVKLIKKILSRVQVLVSKHKKISLTITPKLAHISMLGDEKYLEKLFMNLIRNAIHYNKEKGKIAIDIRKVKNTIVVKVADQGIGITDAERPHIFDRFFRAEKAREMNEVGTGLGLSIVKWVVESHKGSIDVESTEGKGTTFTVVLPVSEHAK